MKNLLTKTMIEAGADAQLITVQSRKYDGRVHREWHGRLVRREDNLILISGAFDDEVEHPQLGRILAGTLSTEYFWTDRWYNVFRFHEPTGELRNFYCNVNSPPEFDGRTLSFVDLDIDVLVLPDFTHRVLDEDEFEENAARFQYPPDVRARARDALAELIALVEKRLFPFDGTF